MRHEALTDRSSGAMQPAARLREEFGEIDVYLFDQLLRSRIVSGMNVLDAGCGAGRNLVFLMRAGFDVWGVDESPMRLRACASSRDLLRRGSRPIGSASSLSRRCRWTTAPWMSSSRVRSSTSRATKNTGTPWCTRMWRVLAPGGILFARLATTVGQTRLEPLGAGRYIMPDGATRFLVTHERLIEVTTVLGGSLLDPLRARRARPAVNGDMGREEKRQRPHLKLRLPRYFVRVASITAAAANGSMWTRTYCTLGTAARIALFTRPPSTWASSSVSVGSACT